jgi:hypothetical protein
MKAAIEETNRRRAVQEAYNLAHGIEPTTIIKGIRDLNDQLRSVAESTTVYTSERDAQVSERMAELDRGKVEALVARMEAEMRIAAKELEFERAAALRDEIQQIRLRVLDEDQSTIIARAAERAGAKAGTQALAGAGSPARARRTALRGSVRASIEDPDAPGSVLEVSSVTVLPAGEEPSEPAEGTAADWLPGIRDEHDDDSSGPSRSFDRPTWDRTVTPNIRRRQGTRPPRRRRS